MRPLTRFQQQKLDSAFRRAWRDDARASQHSRCTYCYDPISTRTATADHRVARAVGGLDHRNNIIACCTDCNLRKGKLREKVFRGFIEHPVSGMPLSLWLIWSRRRLNLALIRMAKNLGVAT